MIMFKKVTLACLPVAIMIFSGCGADNSTQVRMNFITMINATQNSIEANLFNNDNYTLAPKASEDDDYEGVSEAPVVGYDKKGEYTISSSRLINGYVATTCNADEYLAHSPSRGELHIINTTSAELSITINGLPAMTAAPCAITQEAAIFDNKSIAIGVGVNSLTFTPNSDEVYDVVVFEDMSIQAYKIKSIEL
jgi:hypothetical protein